MEESAPARGSHRKRRSCDDRPGNGGCINTVVPNAYSIHHTRREFDRVRAVNESKSVPRGA